GTVISIPDASLGTIGYLTDEQIPAQESLRATFENNQEAFYSYEEREGLASALLPPGMDSSLFQISYWEGYAGVTPDLSEENGWIRIYDSYFPDGSGSAVHRQYGFVHAAVQSYVEGADRTGFDYNLISGNFAMDAPGDGSAYEWAGGSGAYHAVFYYEEEPALQGYRILDYKQVTGGEYSDTTGVYLLEDGVFKYAGHIKDIPRYEGDQEDEEEISDGNDVDENATDEDTPDVEMPDESENPDVTKPPQEDGSDNDSSDGDHEGSGDSGAGEGAGGNDSENDGSDESGGNDGDDESGGNDGSGNGTDTEGNEGSENTPAEGDTASLTWRKLVFVEDAVILLAEAGLQPGPSTDVPPTNNTTPADTSKDNAPGDNTPGDGSQPEGTEQPAAPTTPTEPEKPDEIPSTNPVNPTNPDAGTTQAPPTGSNPADGTVPPAAPGEEIPSFPQIGSGLPEGYYVVEFEYVSGLEEAAALYQLGSAVPVEEAAVDGVIPYDTYNFAPGSGLTPGEDELEAGIEPLMSTIVPDGTFVYAGAGQGQYKLQEVPETEAGSLLMLYNAPTYFKCSGGSDWLERYVFHSLAGDDNESETFDIQVQVVTADQVTSDDVMNADLVYLEAGLGEFLGSSSTIHYMTENGGDMSADVLFSIVYRAVTDLMPVIADYGILTAGYGVAGSGPDGDAGQSPDTGQAPGTEQSLLNYQKLVRILLKKNLSAYYQDMESPDNMMMNLASKDYPDKTDNNYNYVNRNVYIVNDETLVSEDFYEPFDDDKVSAGFMEVLTALKVENSTLSDDDKISEIVSKARAVQYIINYAVGLISDFRDIRVLELQPTTNTNSDLKSDEVKGNTVLYWKKEDTSGSGQQILRSSKVINIDIDTVSVAEFSGDQSDINNKYQMIFIGLDGRRLNHEREDGKRYTVYNDDEMKGIVYSSTGDIATEDGERYEGIDITPQKKNALIDFMKAGYPIVVEDDFFTGQSAKDAGVDEINTDYVDSNSQMYDFLRTAVNEYDDYLYTISDVHSSAVFAAQVNIRRPQIQYVDVDDNEVEEQPRIVQQIRVDAEGRYRATVAYRIEDDRGEAYSDNVDIRVYLDRNQDGRFAPEEEIYDGFTTDNGEFTIEFETPQKGILPWKLEVSDSGNSYRRDALTGFFEVSYDNLTTVRILQIAADESNVNEAGKYNLALAFEADDQTMMGHYLKSAEALTGSDFEIKTMSAAQLEQQLAQNENYLKGFDVLVLGFGPAEKLEGVSGAVNQYIAEGRGVLMSSSAALGDTGRLGIDSSLLGQREVRTYGKLGEEKGDRRYYRYASLSSDMFGPRSGMTVRQINDGSIAHYPFEIGESGTLTQSVKGGDYVLNLLDNGREDSIADVTAWYCLEDPSSDSISAYDISRNDAANNYYVYSRGNVIYVGEDFYPYGYDGTSGVEPSASDEGVTECRLFVNALMAAYNVGIKNPKVTIVAGLASDAPEIESICIPFDEQMIEVADGNVGLLDETTDVYFKITEPNLAFNKKVQISFYYQDDAGGTSIDIGGESVLATPFASQVWTVEENRLVEVGTEFALVPGKVYKIKAPVIPLRTESRTNADIYIVVQSSFAQLGREEPVTGSDSIVLNRAQLFLLE
ncbi:MAG: DUF5057 domain-containing protein, partial [Lachnospiraceae bacterium]|nr:DUF5057 domain-containing protein [Lachnospiraceae bacterium]